MKDSRTNFINYSWLDIYQDSAKLADYINTQIEPENSEIVLLAIARSGSIPATVISNKLKTENKVFTCNYTRYQKNTTGKELLIIQSIPMDDIKRYLATERKKYVFIIDTIADKGETMKAVRSDLITGLSGVNIEKIQTLAICKMTALVDFSVHTASATDWISLPWEV